MSPARVSASRRIDWSCNRIAACSWAAPMLCSPASRAFCTTRSLSCTMRRACFTSSGIATRIWSMRSRRAACSRMTLPLRGTFWPLTTSASSRSTRNWMSIVSPSRGSAPTVLEQQERLLADLLRPRDPQARRNGRQVLSERAGDDQATRGGELREGGAVRLDVGERRVAEREVGFKWPIEERQRVRADHRRAAGKTRRLEVLPERDDGSRALLDECRVGRAPRERLDPERAGAGEQVEHHRVREHRLEDPEQRFADPVRRRAGAAALRYAEPAAFRLAGDDPHL